MHNFKRALAATLGFGLCVVLIAGGIVWPYFSGQWYYYEDAQVRDALSGSLDVLISGASNGYCAFVPAVLDAELGVNSYNISGSLMTMRGRQMLLTQELARNPVKTVFIELSYNAFTRDRLQEGPEGDIYVLARTGSAGAGLRYFFQAFESGEYLNVCADTLDRGVRAWAAMLRGESKKVDAAAKGFYARKTQRVSMSAREFQSLYHTNTLSEELPWENRLIFWDIVEMCQAQDIEVIFVTTPLSDRMLAEYANLESSHQWVSYYAEKYQCTFLDFNLYRDRDALFSDYEDFSDAQHLSKHGAEIFTRELARVYQKCKAGEDISPLFYDDYAQLDEALCANYAAS